VGAEVVEVEAVLVVVEEEALVAEVVVEEVEDSE
jgi:hypothetical protein